MRVTITRNLTRFRLTSHYTSQRRAPLPPLQEQRWNANSRASGTESWIAPGAPNPRATPPRTLPAARASPDDRHPPYTAGPRACGRQLARPHCAALHHGTTRTISYFGSSVVGFVSEKNASRSYLGNT
jgi:hypothetical protein